MTMNEEGWTEKAWQQGESEAERGRPKEIERRVEGGGRCGNELAARVLPPSPRFSVTLAQKESRS
jgi:hypothetical protein